ncbi:MAG: pyridoxal phosphate-dependent aminotransferase [Chlorobi bacterium]|nr:pyridoxal phosphate-dependent aminotransferase [Chlorobiota bacterium]
MEIKNPVIPVDVVNDVLEEHHNPDLGEATIREIVSIVNELEEQTGNKFIRMEMGVPGLPPSRIGIEAEIEALKKGVAAKYPMLDGIKELKENASRFVKAFVDIDISPQGCVPTVGSMQGAFANFMVCGHVDKKKDTFLFIDPGFPVQKQQLMVLGFNYESFDLYHFRGEKLREELERHLKNGNITAIIYSNPNNPTWVCLTDEELKIIGELANKYDVIVLEDLAYFAMDFRKDMSKPFEPPYQPSVGKYTDNYVLLISSSKVFSYAGQRIGVMCISDKLYDRYFPDLYDRYKIGEYGRVLVGRILYGLSSGVGHSSQYALSAMYKKAVEGEFNILDDVREYGERARVMKKMFFDNGFRLVYDNDLGEPVADGFYFTLDYPGMTGGELLKNLLYFGISAISLRITGSSMEGIRACVSQTGTERFTELEDRLKRFKKYADEYLAVKNA